MDGRLIAGVEGGGTKFLAAIARTEEGGPPAILDRLRVTTTDDPKGTLEPVAQWLDGREVTALGIATFGPLDLNAGRVSTTPKAGWSGADVCGMLDLGDSVPVAFDTDVNGAGLAEWRWGAATGASVVLYVTVGTGIGGGVIVGGSPLHGQGHPEMGHIAVPRHPADDMAGVCPSHGACWEGLASGPALERRAGRAARDIHDEDPVWDIEVHYLAHGLADLTLVLSPDVIVVGGGVMRHDGLIDRVAGHTAEILDGYVATPRITLPHFGQEAGLFGALALAERAGAGG